MSLKDTQRIDSFFTQQNFTGVIFVGILLLALFWFGALDLRHLIPSDEGRYAEIAREMVVSGNWIVPRYNEYLYFEKPPLQMWATALTFEIFGLGEWQARLWSGLTSFLTIIFVGYTVSKLWSTPLGIICAIVLAASPLWFVGGHFNSLDMGIAFFLSGALLSLMLALHAQAQSKTEMLWMLVCWSMMAMAVLSKGLIGIVLPGLVLLVYAVTGKDFISLKRLHWFKGLLLFFLITSPWFVMISQKHPIFIDFFFIREHFERFTSNEHQRSAPWYFFLTLLLVGFIPWLFHLPRAFMQAVTNRQDQSSEFKPLWLCFIWVVSITLFFSLSNSKLPGYIFPVIPALAILTGHAIVHLFRSPKITDHSSSKLWQAQLVFFGLLFLGGLFFVSKISKSGQAHEVQAYTQYATIIGATLVFGVLGCVSAWIFRHHAIKSLIVYATTMLVVAFTAGTGHEYLGRASSGYDLAMTAKPYIQKNDPLYGVKTLDHTVPFYLEHPLIMVEFQDELAFGISQEPSRWIPTEKEWLEQWQASPDKKAFALMRHGTYDDLVKQNVPMEIIAKDATRVIVGKPLKNN